MQEMMHRLSNILGEYQSRRTVSIEFCDPSFPRQLSVISLLQYPRTYMSVYLYSKSKSLRSHYLINSFCSFEHILTPTVLKMGLKILQCSNSAQKIFQMAFIWLVFLQCIRKTLNLFPGMKISHSQYVGQAWPDRITGAPWSRLELNCF